MVRLRTVSPSMPGWTRRRQGRGFAYLGADGRPLPPEDVERIRALVIPPAWRDVWICPFPHGHLQAVGTDDAGRRQYLYHPQWRLKRDRMKFDRVLAAAERMEKARRRITADLALSGMPLERSTAVAARLLDVGAFRIGNDVYAEAGSFGLTTLERRHVHQRNGVLVFSFTGKSGIEHTIEIADPEVSEALRAMRRRRSGERLLAYQQRRRWLDLVADDVNGYLRDLFDGDLTAKDFRTWHGTVLAATELALTDEPGTSEASRKRAVRAAVQQVADYLGNTPTVARSSYIDPRVIDLYSNGTTIGEAARKRHRTPESRRRALERAVLEMLAG